jgi:hypothetical protein
MERNFFYIVICFAILNCNKINNNKLNRNNQLDLGSNTCIVIVSKELVFLKNKKQPFFALSIRLDLLNKIQLLEKDKNSTFHDSLLIGYSNMKNKNIDFQYLPIDINYDTTIVKNDIFHFYTLDKLPTNMFWGEPFKLTLCYNHSQKRYCGYYIYFNTIWDGCEPILDKYGNFPLPRKSVSLDTVNYCLGN